MSFRRSVIDPDRDLHEGVVEVDRGSERKSDFAGDVFFEPGPLAKSSPMATLLYGLSGDYRHDPRVVGAGLLPRSHVPFTDEAPGAALITACKHADVTSMNSSFAATAAFIATCHGPTRQSAQIGSSHPAATSSQARDNGISLLRPTSLTE